MKIYTYKFCPYCFRALLALEQKQISAASIQIEELEHGQKPAQLLNVNPSGTVPSVVFPDGTGFAESMLLVEYIDTLESAAPKLYGNTPQESMRVKFDVERINNLATSFLSRSIVTRGNLVTEREAQQNIPKCFANLEAWLSNKNTEFLGGNNINAIDINIAPFILLYSAICSIKTHFIVPTAGSRTAQYFQSILGHPAVKNRLPSLEQCTEAVKTLITPGLEIAQIKNASRSLSSNLEADLEQLNKKTAPQTWTLGNSAQGSFIETQFTFANYDVAIKAITSLCALQESSDHHSNFVLENFNTLKVECCTHQPKWGVSGMDFAFAEVLTKKLKE